MELVIKAWLLNTQRPYQEGVALYQKYGTNPFLKQRLAAGPDAYNKRKLEEELQALLKPCAVDTAEKLAVSTTGTKPSLADQARYLLLLKKRDDVLKQIERNMALLEYTHDKNILFDTAKQILKLHQKKTETWAQIDYYQKHDSFETFPEAEPIPKAKEIQQLRQAISKAGKRLQNQQCKDPVKTQALLDKHRERLQVLTRNEQHPS